MCQAGKWLNIEHNEWNHYDISGKLMGLQSYGNILPKFKETLDYDILSINKLFDRENYFKFMNSQLLGTLKPLDWIRTCLLYTSPSPRDRG